MRSGLAALEAGANRSIVTTAVSMTIPATLVIPRTGKSNMRLPQLRPHCLPSLVP